MMAGGPRDGHGLQPDAPRVREHGIEESLSTKNYVLHALYRLDVNGDALLEARHVASVDYHLLTRFKHVFGEIAI